MATGAALKTVETSPEFDTKVVPVRGTDYTLTELDGSAYDACVELATVQVEGKEQIKFDVLYRAMLEKSLVSPRLNMAEINKKPMGVRTALIDAVVALHWPPTPQPKADEDEGKGKG